MSYSSKKMVFFDFVKLPTLVAIASPQSTVAPRFSDDAQQVVANSVNDDVIAVEEDEADAAPSENWTENLCSVYSRPAVARTCKECEVSFCLAIIFLKSLQILRMILRRTYQHVS